MVTELQAGRPEFDSWQGKGYFFSSPPLRYWLWGPFSLYKMGTGGSFVRGKATEAWIWSLTSI